VQLYFLSFKICAHVFCVISLHIKSLTESCKTKVKHTPISCQRRLYGFQWNTTCSLYHLIRKWILYSLIFLKKKLSNHCQLILWKAWHFWIYTPPMAIEWPSSNEIDACEYIEKNSQCIKDMGTTKTEETLYIWANAF
jgi:hypothetical protein